MTTAALTVPYLDVPTQEDVMELSTDFDRHQGTDGDTDIDIDLVPNQPQDQDDDYMIEDARSERGTGGQAFPNELGNDDVMLDEEGSQGDIHEANFLQDEDLDDAGDYLQDDTNQDSLALHENTDEYHDDSLQRTHQSTSQLGRVFSALPDQRDDNTREHHENEILDNPEEDVLGPLDTEDNAEVLKQSFLDSTIEDPAGSVLEDSRDVLDWSELPTSIGNTETVHRTTSEVYEGGTRPEGDTSEVGSPKPTSMEPQHQQAQEATSVHPVVVVYQDIEISLFPPSDQSDSPTFFLHDESLATSSIYDLLLACKGVLADSISEEDELELNIEELGLCISEESKSAPHTTLSQILNVYLQLLHLDGTTDAGPLYMNLRIRTSFPKRLRGLIDAAKDGKGLSQLPYWEVSSDDDTATAADGDIAYGTAEEQNEELEAPDGATDAVYLDLVDKNSTQSQLGTFKDDATVSQNEPVVLEPSHDHDRSSVPKMERAALPSGPHEPPTPEDILKTTLLGNTDSGTTEDHGIPPSDDAQDTLRSHDSATSAPISRANVEDGDLIDYEEGENAQIQDSTGSSTLAGIEAAGAANGMSISSFERCTQPNICYCALCNNLFTTEDQRNSEHDHEINSLTTESTSEISNSAPVETEESIPLTREAEQGQEDTNHHTHQIQEDYQENGDDGDYELGGDEETFQTGTDNATAKPIEQHSQILRADDSEESVVLDTGADDGDNGDETIGVPGRYNTQLLRVNGHAQQHPANPTVAIGESNPEPEDTIDAYDQITDELETNQADSEAVRHDLSGNNGVVIGKPDDQNPYAVTPALADDNDEIDYEDDDIVDLLSQQTQEDLLNPELPSPPKPASIKRSRGENAEQDAPEYGSQDIKRVRSS